MKTSVDIPDEMLAQLLKTTRAHTKRQAILTAIEQYNQRQRMAEIDEILGTFEDFMTQDELECMRAEA